MIEIVDLHKSFGDLQVLKGINLEVKKGEVLSVIGASGSGKSTLLYCINGLEPIQQGSIKVDSIEVHAKGTDLNKLRQRLGMVFQQWNSFPHLTVLENVTLAPRIVRGLSKQDASDLAIKQLEHVGLGDKIKNYPAALSGGQQQRLAIARALAMEPNYMLFDEATSALDPELVRAMSRTGSPTSTRASWRRSGRHPRSSAMPSRSAPGGSSPRSDKSRGREARRRKRQKAP